MSITALLHTVVEGRSLTEAQAQDAMRALLAGESTPVLTAAFLTALRMKGETVDELTGFARAMRAAALTVPVEDAYRPVLDTCGTGGKRHLYIQHFDCCGFRRRRRRRARGQARESIHLEPMRQRGCAGGRSVCAPLSSPQL